MFDKLDKEKFENVEGNNENGFAPEELADVPDNILTEEEASVLDSVDSSSAKDLLEDSESSESSATAVLGEKEYEVDERLNAGETFEGSYIGWCQRACRQAKVPVGKGS